MKRWYRSKTVWINALTLAAMILATVAARPPSRRASWTSTSTSSICPIRRSSDNRDCYWGHPERALPPPSFMVSESGIVTQVPKEFVRKWWGEIVNGLPDEKAKVHEPGKVWYFNGEDPLDEIHRRVVAAMRHHKIEAQDIGENLFLDSGRSQPIVVGVQTRDGALIQEPIVEAVVDTIKRHKIDVVTLDPFVSTHQVSENDNNDSDDGAVADADG